ncbi:MAG TPA: ribosome recycling factor [Rhodothermales bacterium]|nr:ribosome recycling factor [Rhodothermales bacterium]
MLDEDLLLLLDEAASHMDKAIEHLRHELHGLRAGRATPAMLDGIKVEYYGTITPLGQMASVSAPQADLLVVQPWDRSALNGIEKAIRASNLGLNPGNDGSLIRIPVPTPTEERRREIVKVAKAKGEEARIAVRNVRRSTKDEIKSVADDKRLPEDMRFEAEERLQKLTDAHVAKVDEILHKKEAEIMEV